MSRSRLLQHDPLIQRDVSVSPSRYYRRALPAFCWFVALWMLVFRLGDFPLIEPDEGRNAEVSREMLNSGSWLVPTLDGIPYLDKPAFFFRSVAVAMSLFGQNEMAARLPSALGTLAILVMLFGFCRRHYGEPAASLAVLVAATTPFLFAFSRLIIMETVLGFFTCAAIFSACLAEEAEARAKTRARRVWYLVSAAAAGCATLVKGPVGFLIPALVVTIFNRVDGRRGAIRRCFAPLNLVAFFAVVLPWFIALCLRHPDFVSYGLAEETFRRFTSGGEFRHAEPFYYYVPVVIVGFFPWSLLLPESMLFAWKRRGRWTSPDRLFVVWAVVTIVFFSISRTKQPAYVLITFVALAALLGRLFGYAFERRDNPASGLIQRALLAWVVICGFLSVAAGFVASGSHVPGVEPDQPVIVPVALVAAFAAITLIAAVGFWRRSILLGAISFSLCSFSLITAAFPTLEAYTKTRSARDLARELADLPQGTEIVSYHCFPGGLAFYQRRFLPMFDTRGTPEQMRSNYILALWRRDALQSDMVLDVNQLDAWADAKRAPVFVLTNSTGRYWLGIMAAKSGFPVRNIAPGWWGFLIPARGGD